MHTKRNVKFLAVLAALFITAAAASAHNGMEHVMGTVTSVTDSTITVETVRHKTVAVLLDPKTTFTHSNTPSSWKELHVGDRVVIHAKANAAKQLIGVTVQWGAPSPQEPNHSH